jgi:hypothetical protein
LATRQPISEILAADDATLNTLIELLEERNANV